MQFDVDRRDSLLRVANHALQVGGDLLLEMLLKQRALLGGQDQALFRQFRIESLFERVGALRPLLIDDAHDESVVAGLRRRGMALGGHCALQLREVAPDLALHAIPVRLLRRDIDQCLLGAPGNGQRGLDAPCRRVVRQRQIRNGNGHEAGLLRVRL